MTFTCPYFSPEMMVTLSTRVRGHFVTLVEVCMHLIECNAGTYQLSQ